MQTTRPDRTLVAILSIIGVIVILAVVVVFTRSTPTPLDPSTPAGVVQAYAHAVIAGSRGEATDLLVGDVSENCERAETPDVTGTRVTLLSASENDDTATVRVSIAQNYGGGVFGADSYESEETFTLVDEGGEWRIDSAPWQFTICFNTVGEK